jgi:hypothetical protein
MPLIVVASTDLIRADAFVRASESQFIDFANLVPSKLAEQAEQVRLHQTSMTTLYLGFLDPVWMLTPHHETILRRAIRACRVVLVTSDPGTLSLFWKNGLTHLHILP